MEVSLHAVGPLIRPWTKLQGSTRSFKFELRYVVYNTFRSVHSTQ